MFQPFRVGTSYDHNVMRKRSYGAASKGSEFSPTPIVDRHELINDSLQHNREVLWADALLTLVTYSKAFSARGHQVLCANGEFVHISILFFFCFCNVLFPVRIVAHVRPPFDDTLSATWTSPQFSVCFLNAWVHTTSFISGYLPERSGGLSIAGRQTSITIM